MSRGLFRRLAGPAFAALFLAVLPAVPAAAPVHLATTPAASSGWLDRLNAWRANTGVSPLTENTTWSAGDSAHAVYMVKNDLVTHYETPGAPYYTTAGDTAARNGNIQVSSSTSTTDTDAIDWWMAAPFHAMAMMDPRLSQTGFGSYREVKSGWDEGAALDTVRGNSFTGGSYPVFFPGNGATEPLTTYNGGEFPDPLQGCPFYTAPTGLPLFIEVGGNVDTTIGPAHQLTGNGVPLYHCVIDSSNAALGSYLRMRGGVIVIPQQPLLPGVRYTMSLTVNGTPYTWSFTVGAFFNVSGVTPRSGAPAGGTAVTISGSGFTNGLTSVKFGATAASSYTVLNDATVTAVSPPHAVGPVDVTVTTASGTSRITSADQFTFATPCTSVTISASPPSPAGSGTVVTATGAATCPSANPAYEFWMRSASQPNWQLVQAYSTNNKFQWNTSGTAAGIVYLGVWARDANSSGTGGTAPDTYDAFASLPFTVQTLMCTGATISAAPASPISSGPTVTFTGSSAGCPNPSYQFLMRPASQSSWQVVQAYSTSRTFSWSSSGVTGLTYFGVWAKDASSLAAVDSYSSIPYVVNGPSCTSVGISDSPGPPQVAGTQITFTAVAAGCGHPNPLYQFLIRPASQANWQVVQTYSTSPMFNWNSTGASGTVYVGVWAKDASSAAAYDAVVSTPFLINPACSSVTISGSPASPQSAGTQVAFTAFASGCPDASPLYQFLIRPAAQSSWQVVQTYSTSPTLNWNSSGFSGTVYIGVWTKDASSPAAYDAVVSTPYVVNPASCTSVTVSTAPASPQASGTLVTFTAVAAGCTDANPLYEFWFLNGSTWQVVRGWSTTATWTWNTTGGLPGTYHLGVWVRDAASPGVNSTTLGSYDAYAPISFQVS